ncbi:fused signal recognition particle receptor [Streptococcus equinus]|jgi:fused signal recognition particle receptor|uniref:Signal recognition particle receptor FtsY n=1 Tax=Streptococcus equinus TaxID=1335 RepID=A0A239R821_STREI|nr:signal recognition particle-docking protein FtsY [Streptococcus equinus]SEK23984.1 fused signal recognition particle receptor [Streptococcus equinus]SNU06560.1 fused signal recognition particle receptor [Streptococcus equinus]
MGLFDRLFGKKKDTEEVVEEQKNTQELDKKEAEETLDTTVAEPATEETVSEDVEQVAGEEATQEPSTSDESSETTSNEFSDVMADYYAKKEAAQAALDRGETVEFEAVETRKEVEEVSEPEAPASAPVETEEEKYNRSLKKTRTGFSARLNAFLANFRRVDEDFFEELEEMLILSDVGVNVATQLTEDLRYEAKLENAKKADDLKRVIIEKLVEIYEKDGVFNEKINFQDDLTVMLFVGVNGVGKTTSIGKLAYKYKNEGKKVMLVAADTFRAGAVAQLAEWGRRVGVPVVTGPEKADPASVVFDGMERAVAENVDVLLIDTAGRLQNKDNLMAELEKIGRIIKRVVPDAPHETLLALDASTGQNALSQAKEFSKITPLTGLILTKIDGTAKGGVVLAIRQELDIPVKFIGFGEKIDDIGEFDSEDFIRGLLEGII